MELFTYCGLDWLAYLLGVVQMWLLGGNVRTGWLVGVAAAFSGIGFAVIAGSAAAMVFNLLFAALYVHNYRRSIC